MNPFNIQTTQSQNPFDSTPLGIAVNTVTGLPKAAVQVGTGILGFLNKTFPGLSTAVYGLKTGDWKPYVNSSKNLPNLRNRKELITTTIGSIDPLHGKGKVLRNAVKDTLENFFIKETKPKVIQKVLEEMGHPSISVKTTAKELAKSKTAQEVRSILNPTPIKVLTQAIAESKPLRGEIETLQSAERAKRFAAASQAQTKVGGEQGYFAGLSKLKGALLEKPPEFTPPRNLLPKEGIDTLFTAIQKNPVLNTGEQLTAQNGLKKLLDGHVPVPSELKVLEEVFGSDVVRAIYDKRPLGKKIWDVVGEVVADIPRALQTTLDMSATFRQASVLGLSHPIRFTQAFAKSFRSMISKNYFEKALDTMKLTPEYKVASDAGLRLSDPRKLFGGREEYFLSNLAEKIPGIGKIVQGANRAYVGMLNTLRFSVFNDITASFKQTGLASEKNIKSLADFINTASGSGGLGALEKHATLLSKVLYAPRFISSKIQFMNPVWYAKQPAPVRKEALKTFGTYVGTVTSIITLAKMGGADVETDWRSSNYGKMKVGNTYYDLTNGFGQYIRLFGQSITNEKKTGKGNIEEYGTNKPFSETRLDNLARVGRGKLAPFLSALGNLYAGKNVVGEPVTIKSTLIDQVTPLYVQDLVEALNDRGAEALFSVGLPAFFGISTQTFNNQSKTTNPFNR